MTEAAWYQISVSSSQESGYYRRVHICVSASNIDLVLELAKNQLIDFAGQYVDMPNFTNPNLLLAEKITDLDNWSDEVDVDMRAWHEKYPKVKDFTILTKRLYDDGEVTYHLKKIQLSGRLLEMNIKAETDPNHVSGIADPEEARATKAKRWRGYRIKYR